MEVDLIFKIAAIGIIVAVLHQLLVRSGRSRHHCLFLPAGAHQQLMKHRDNNPDCSNLKNFRIVLKKQFMTY